MRFSAPLGGRVIRPARFLVPLHRTRWGWFTRELSWGVSDQALISATNFVTMIALARTLSPSGFGGFTLVYAGLLYANSLQGALLTQPHNVLGPATEEQGWYEVYTTSAGALQLLFATSAASISLLAALGAYLAHARWSNLLVCLAVAIFGWQVQEFVRRVFYTEGSLRSAFLNDAIAYGGQAIVIVVLVLVGSATAARALLVIGLTSFSAAGVGVFLLRSRLRVPSVRRAASLNFAFGKWLAGGTSAYWLSGQLYPYLVAAVVGVAAAGEMRAALLLLGPLNIVLAFLSTVLPTRLSRARIARGDASLRRGLARAQLAGLPIVIGYGVVVALFLPTCLSFFTERDTRTPVRLSRSSRPTTSLSSLPRRSLPACARCTERVQSFAPTLSRLVSRSEADGG